MNQRMREDDLDSENLENIVVTPYRMKEQIQIPFNLK